jgi:hypothetical protein
MDRVDVVKLLLARGGIQINQARTDGSNPLYIACHMGRVDVVRLLLARKEIQINQVRIDGSTPLYIACFNGHVDMVRLLLSFVNWKISDQSAPDGGALWSTAPVPLQQPFSNYYVHNAWPPGLIETTKLVVADGVFTANQFDNITSFPTTTFQLNGFNIMTQLIGIQCPVRCLPCKHVHNAAFLLESRKYAKHCPSCKVVSTHIALMSEIDIKRWNHMESQEKKGEVKIKNLRDQEKALEAEQKALEAERVLLQNAEKTFNFQNRYHQFIKHT